MKHENEEWVSDCWLTPSEQFSAISRQEQVTFPWDNNDVRFAYLAGFLKWEFTQTTVRR